MLGEQPWAVPLLWPAPGNALLDWRNRFNATLAEIEAQIAASTAADPNLPASSKRRLALLHESYTRYQQEVSALLAPLQVGEALATETHLALRTRLPSHHGVLSYAPNIHRDWCWGDAENQQVRDHLLKALEKAGADQLAGKSAMLILGCGAGRLAYDLHEQLGAEETWALDSNPLLCFIGSRVSHGERLELTEFPLAPVSLDDAARPRVLRAPASAEHLHFVCADGLCPPFAAGSFDLVVTPWLIDVVDAPVSSTLQVIARLLKPGGTWLQHGSVAFSGAGPEHRLTADELAELSEACGFAVVHREDQLLAYLQSPASRQQRQELTHTQVALRNTVPTDRPRQLPQHVPEWIVDSRLAVPLTPAFQTQITTVRIHAFIMSLIDGKRSIRDMAAVLQEQRLMPAQQAEEAIRRFLTTMHEEAAHKDGIASGS
jgi:SAM-dependent methyltransferase